MILGSLNKVWIVAVLAVAGVPGAFTQSQVPKVEAVLNDLHDAASKADFNRYFSHFAKDAIFLGTDPLERWTTSQFKAYAKPIFQRGGWTYMPRERHVFLSKEGRVAWFDETIYSKKYGGMRGTGTLVRSGTTWKLVQYNLLKPIPNDLFVKIVEMIDAPTTANSPSQKPSPPVK